MDPQNLTYKKAGVDIDEASLAKRRMATYVDDGNPKVLTKLGAFASVIEGSFPSVADPVLVLKMEEPGSKQLLAIQHGAIESLGRDLINHLINDIAVMGAQPLAVLDAIICGKLESNIVVQLVEAMAKACNEHQCSLIGGETSEQPDVLLPGRYILSAAVVGVVDRNRVIDGSKISEGCKLLAVASNGLHTNGYSLVRKLLENNSNLADEQVDSGTFLDAVLRPHTPYYPALKRLFSYDGLLGLAHITGGGIEGNLSRIIPEGLSAEVHLPEIKILPIFKKIRDVGNLEDCEMLKVFNMGVGLIAVVKPDFIDFAKDELQATGYIAYSIGQVIKGNKKVIMTGELNW